jgi:hypothetical protein
LRLSRDHDTFLKNDGMSDLPDECDQFSGDGDGGDFVVFAAENKASIFATQAQLGSPCDVDDGLRKVLLTLANDLTDFGTMNVLPSGFDEQTTCVSERG